MKQILVISGKGGTGKTSIVGGLASLAENAVLADCDVDAPDLHIILQPRMREQLPFYALKTAVKDDSKCTLCGRCLETCRFNAIGENLQIQEYKCEGCGACAFVCPEDAIEMVQKEAGRIYLSETRFGTLVHANLNIGEEASGKLVTDVKKKALEVAEKEGRDLLLVDGSPGIGCPVIASLAGVDLALIVTEPTVSGLHDLDRIIKVTEHFEISAAACINKCDINEKKTKDIEEYCRSKGIEVVGKIPYDSSVTQAMIALKTVVEYDSPIKEEIMRMWSKMVGK